MRAASRHDPDGLRSQGPVEPVGRPSPRHTLEKLLQHGRIRRAEHRRAEHDGVGGGQAPHVALDASLIQWPGAEVHRRRRDPRVRLARRLQYQADEAIGIATGLRSHYRENVDRLVQVVSLPAVRI